MNETDTPAGRRLAEEIGELYELGCSRRTSGPMVDALSEVFQRCIETLRELELDHDSHVEQIRDEQAQAARS